MRESLYVLVPAVPVSDLNRISQALAGTWPDARVHPRRDGERGVAIYLEGEPEGTDE
ncbi:hypothetical protein [Mycolicibacterium conceptionense]|uniref:hypothetical protein n=1 Tax=Mycolicibacterium conceptionense TaxID=451644 RepID=UPI000A943C5F|nr:hypothetical protein [Mycolicibacterium conceptionense]